MNVESISWRRQVTQSFLLKRKTSASSSLISLQFLIPFPFISIWLLFNFLSFEYSSPTHDVFPTPIILSDVPIFHSFVSFRIILSLQLLDFHSFFPWEVKLLKNNSNLVKTVSQSLLFDRDQVAQMFQLLSSWFALSLLCSLVKYKVRKNNFL